MTTGQSLLGTWWRDRVDYRWVIQTFATHSALGPIKAMIGSAGLVMALITGLSALSPAGQYGPIGTAQAAATVALAVLWALRWWLLPWPSETESLVWIVLVDVTITIQNIMVRDPLVGAWGVVLVVAISGYVTTCHGPRVLVAQAGWALLSSLLMAWLMYIGEPGRLGHGRGDVFLCAGTFLGDFVVTCVVLPTVHFCHWLTQRDAQSDPLTGLLNRRGLDSRLSLHFDSCGRGAIYAVLFDLDRFKSVNDTFGHLFGDEILARTARCLRAAAAPDALVARTGGEEFAVVGRLAAGETVDAIAARLLAAIESMPGPVTITASAGAAVTHSSDLVRPHLEAERRTLFHRADSAMYEAKRLGGNTAVTAPPACRVQSPSDTAGSGPPQPIFRPPPAPEPR